MTIANNDPLNSIFTIYGSLGTERYADKINQKAHALQAAANAEAAGAPESLVVAALLHDIGHLIHKMGADAAARGIDARHELIGAHQLGDLFGPEVTEPIRLHVAAKRYLCAAEPEYFATLSPGSVRSLNLQGGPFPPELAQRFIAHPYAEQAVNLRRWDEAAKVPGARTREFEEYRELLESCLRVAA